MSKKKKVVVKKAEPKLYKVQVGGSIYRIKAHSASEAKRQITGQLAREIREETIIEKAKTAEKEKKEAQKKVKKETG